MSRTRRRVLFLCTHNSARSQMAEALLRHLGGGAFEAASAGTEPSRVHPLAVEAMARRGIDLAGHRSKHLDELREERFEDVITVCDSANQACPVFPGETRRLHWSLPDPSAVEGAEESRRAAFEATAAELERRIRSFVGRE
ncbi:MAG TPA: arsenate reductase ArsC [Thermoanaerobaculia bacterium]|nr:arsenate reductase ArsC [Thermoanaerobaculia bacterium]